MTAGNTEPDALRRDLVAMTRGDERAARAVWDLLAPRLTALARGVLRDSHAAEDAVQDALCAVVGSKRSSLRRVRDPEAWLFVLVRNASIDRLRKRNAPGPAGPVSRSPDREREHADLAAALEQLPEDQREIVRLRHASGLSFTRLADALGQPRSTVADRYAAGIESLRHALGAEPSGAVVHQTQKAQP